MKESDDNLPQNNDSLTFRETILRVLFIMLLAVALPIYMVVRVTGNFIKSLKSKDARDR